MVACLAGMCLTGQTHMALYLTSQTREIGLQLQSIAAVRSTCPWHRGHDILCSDVHARGHSMVWLIDCCS
jgi:hypothetical protein